jgi:class 3 adenylate cyclase
MAFEMRERMRSMQAVWAARYNEAFQVGVGITTGWVTVGDIGSEARSDYTVLGNEVNLASRLSDNATAGQILVTEPTLEAVGDLVRAAPVEGIELKGVSRDVAIFEINPNGAVTA